MALHPVRPAGFGGRGPDDPGTPVLATFSGDASRVLVVTWIVETWAVDVFHRERDAWTFEASLALSAGERINTVASDARAARIVVGTDHLVAVYRLDRVPARGSMP